ncbi:uncharacterized protein LOC125949350 isoform X2 [Anopheles darlingi]|uniref:uncharacterized protein LOC125949350 isoform X2 n=1 Tax=Anopheles darlingi TaxID=43151 RepID=UPI0021003888|nr:uncharacterized protein LOC125949350 isoform X2 [Anopheles darlingi]
MEAQTVGKFSLMELNIKLLRRIGLWNETERERFPIRGQLVIVFNMFWLIPSAAYFVTSQYELTPVLKAINEQIIFTTAFSKFCLFASNFRHWQHIFYDLQRCLNLVVPDPHEDVQKILNRVVKSEHRLIKWYSPLVIFDTMVYGLAPFIFVLAKYAVTGAYKTPLPTPIQANYFIPGYDTNVWVWIPLNIFLGLMLALQSVALVLLECFVWNSIYSTISLFKILQIKAKSLVARDDRHQWSTELSKFVDLHECAFRCAFTLEKALGTQMLFLHIAIIFSMCLMMTVITIAFKDTYLMFIMLAVLVYSLFQIFCFSILGTELTQQSAAVKDAIFHSKWYLREKRQQRDLAFVLVHSQQPVKLTAAKLFTVTRQSFMQVIKHAYTMFTLMSQFVVESTE